MRILKTNSLLRLYNSYIVDSPQPANISYLWNFGSLLALCLIIQILSGVFLAMHYTPNVDLAFNSVEHDLILGLIWFNLFFVFFLVLFLLYNFSLIFRLHYINYLASLTEPFLSQKIEKGSQGYLNLVTSNTYNYKHFIIKLKKFKALEIILFFKRIRLQKKFITYLNWSKYKENNQLENKNPLLVNPSLTKINKKKELSNEELIEWLKGFTDSKGCFLISMTKFKNNKGINTFKNISFKYIIFLLKDDAPMLNIIKSKLNLGNIRVYERFVNFEVSKKKDIEKIIDIFSKNPLNTSNYLNFIEFKKAYYLYQNMLNSNVHDNKYKLKIFEDLLSIKNSMNRKRTSFELPNEHSIKITPYWLLGFLEGVGSFTINNKKYFSLESLEFGISQTLSEKKIMLEIKKFLLDLPGKYHIRYINSNVVPIYEDKKAKNDSSKPMVKIQITNTNFIKNVIIPFLDNLIWLSKKELDYLDWRIVLNLKMEGKHFLPQGKEIITAISQRMNLNRFSTNIKHFSYKFALRPLPIEWVEENKFSIYHPLDRVNINIINKKDLDSKIKLLLEAPSNFEYHQNSIIFIKSEGKYLKSRGNINVEVYNKHL